MARSCVIWAKYKNIWDNGGYEGISIDELIIHADGGSRGNPGPTAAAARAFIRVGNEWYKGPAIAAKLGILGTSMAAELMAAYFAIVITVCVVASYDIFEDNCLLQARWRTIKALAVPINLYSGLPLTSLGTTPCGVSLTGRLSSVKQDGPRARTLTCPQRLVA